MMSSLRILSLKRRVVIQDKRLRLQEKQIQYLYEQMLKHAGIPQFEIPDTWTKLQKEQYELNQLYGLPDNRTDCTINTLAFCGQLERDTAEQISSQINARQIGLYPYEMAAYLERNDGYVKRPRIVKRVDTLDAVIRAYDQLKNNHSAIININRPFGPGHAATVVKLNNVLKIFDPQVEVLTHDVGEWLSQQHTASVDIIVETSKKSHLREESSNVEVRKPDNDECISKRRKQVVVAKNPKRMEKLKQVKKDKRWKKHLEDMAAVGFNALRL
jgi:hypothetical protein